MTDKQRLDALHALAEVAAALSSRHHDHRMAVSRTQGVLHSLGLKTLDTHENSVTASDRGLAALKETA
jgi:hypothetical protein